MPLSLPQTTIALDRHRFITAVCGRRFGKSHLALRQLCRAASVPDSLVYYVSPTYGMSKRIMWKPLKKKLLSLNWVKKINESDLTITLINDSEICLKSADNPDSLRGVGLDFVCIDEAADCEPEVWYEVLRPTLSDTGGGCLFLGTPKGMNWLKDIYDMPKTDPDTWSSYQFTTLDGGNVPAAEIESAKRDLDERTFRAEYLASFEQYAGLIYYSFGEHNLGDTPDITDRDLLLIGLDFNVQPLSAVVATRRENHLFVHHEITIDGASTHDLITEVRRRWPMNRVEVFPDSSGSQRRTSSTTTDHTILANAQWTMRVGRINPPVLDRIAAVNSRLRTTLGTSHITINRTCKKLVKGLSGQVYQEGTRLPQKGGSNDLSHLNDAFGYLVHWLWPIKRDIDTTNQPKTWGRY